jgi:hypothetical protein
LTSGTSLQRIDWRGRTYEWYIARHKLWLRIILQKHCRELYSRSWELSSWDTHTLVSTHSQPSPLPPVNEGACWSSLGLENHSMEDMWAEESVVDHLASVINVTIPRVGIEYSDEPNIILCSYRILLL